MINQNMQNPNSAPSSTSGGQNGVSSAGDPALSRALFTQMVAQREPSQRSEPESSPQPPAEGDPENPNPPAESDQPGQDNLPSEEPSPGEGNETPPADGEQENDLSPGGDQATTGNAELDEALRGLNDDARKHLIEMAQDITSGKTSIGELKRGHKLQGQFQSQIEALQQQIADLKAGKVSSDTLEGAPDQRTASVPKSVAKLKTIEEVEQQAELAEQSVRAIEDLLEEGSDGAEVDGKQFTRKQLIEIKRQWQDELRALPKRAQQIAAQTTVQSQQRQIREALQAKVPQYFDPENAIGKKAQELIKADSYLGSLPNRDFVALALAIGTEQLTKQLSPANGAARVDALAAARTAKPATNGKVQLGKPHNASGTPPPRAAGGIPVKAALDQVRKDGSRDSLATLIKATGR